VELRNAGKKKKKLFFLFFPAFIFPIVFWGVIIQIGIVSHEKITVTQILVIVKGRGGQDPVVEYSSNSDDIALENGSGGDHSALC
jgi:hypothetical protein